MNDVKIFSWGHPSPLNTMNQTDNPKNFIYSDVFAKTSAIMTINWDPNHNMIEIKNYSDQIFGNIDKKQYLYDESEMPERDPAIPVDKFENNKKYSIFTDGAASANGKENCRASYGFYIVQTIENSHVDIVKKSGIVPALEITGEKYSSSNNRGELSAILHAVEYILSNNLHNSFIEIVSDSQYSINCVEKWAPNWLANPSKHSLSTKKNMDLIKPIIDKLKIIRKTCRVVFKHVRSHKTAPAKNTLEWFYWNGNDIADQLCTSELSKNS
jgi:ribonuclease HI